MLLTWMLAGRGETESGGSQMGMKNEVAEAMFKGVTRACEETRVLLTCNSTHHQNPAKMKSLMRKVFCVPRMKSVYLCRFRTDLYRSIEQQLTS
jgi:hypothetical protein